MLTRRIIFGQFLGQKCAYEGGSAVLGSYNALIYLRKHSMKLLFNNMPLWL
jgi:hypothetical protein